MNKTTLLVLTCALFLAFAGLQAAAQSSDDQAASQPSSMAQGATDPSQATADPEVRAKVQAKLQQISTELNLTDDQKAQIKPILTDEVQQLKAVNGDASLSPDQKRTKAGDIHQSHKSQINS